MNNRSTIPALVILVVLWFAPLTRVEAAQSPFVLLRSLLNPGANTADYFGAPMAMDGQRLAVGVYANNTGAQNAGVVHVYDLEGGGATSPVLTLTNPTPAAQERFGSSVALSGNRLVVCTDWLTFAGETANAYVYDLAGVSPTMPVAVLTNADSSLRAAIAGSWLAVSAITRGNVSVYNLAGSSPTVPVLVLTNPNPAGVYRYGTALAMDGTKLVVGSYEDDTGALDAGAVYLYDLASPSTAPFLTLTNPAPAAGDGFGAVVALEENLLMVGEYYSFGGPTVPGRAYLFNLTTPTPTLPVHTFIRPEPSGGNLFGAGVALRGTRVAVSTLNRGELSTNQGRVYLYELTGATPTVPIAILADPAPEVDNDYGGPVMMNDQLIVVGASRRDTPWRDGGAAYVFGAPPTVHIAPAALPGSAVLSWSPASSSGFVLQSKDHLAAANWTNAVSGETNPVIILLTNGVQFYRLRQP